MARGCWAGDYSLAGNPTPFSQGSPKPTYVDDTKAWNSGEPVGDVYNIRPPAGVSSNDFDAAVVHQGNSYDSKAGYDAKFGPNSNTATEKIVEKADGKLPNIPGAYGQNYGKP